MGSMVPQRRFTGDDPDRSGWPCLAEAARRAQKITSARAGSGRRQGPGRGSTSTRSPPEPPAPGNFERFATAIPTESGRLNDGWPDGRFDSRIGPF